MHPPQVETVGGIDAASSDSTLDKGSEVNESKIQRTVPGASALRAAVRAIAEAKDHDLEIAEAFVDPTAEIAGLVEKGSLLTLTASQAEDAGFASRADSLEAVLASQNLEEEIGKRAMPVFPLIVYRLIRPRS